MTNPIDFNDFLSGFSGRKKENAEKILGKAFEKNRDEETDEDVMSIVGSRMWMQQKYPGLFPNWKK